MTLWPLLAGEHRLHHGLTGCVLIGVGVVLVLTDLSDYRRWIPELIHYGK